MRILGISTMAFGAIASLAVLLAASGQAPPSFSNHDVGPSSTGLEGQTVLGPTCPLQSVSSECADKPAPATTVRVEQATANGNGSGAVIARVRADTNGKFKLILPPGRYVVTAEPAPGQPEGVAKPQLIVVEKGLFTRVVLQFQGGLQ